MEEYDGTYIDGTNQETFNASFDSILAALLIPDDRECLYVECCRCKHHQQDKDFYTCESCGHDTGVAIYD